MHQIRYIICTIRLDNILQNEPSALDSGVIIYTKLLKHQNIGPKDCKRWHVKSTEICFLDNCI